MADTLRKIGHCIICHQDNVPMSDEYVIPKSIGGHVDPLLTDHPMIQLLVTLGQTSL